MRYMILALSLFLVHCGGSNTRAAAAADQQAAAEAAAPAPAGEQVEMFFAWPAGKYQLVHEFSQISDGMSGPGTLRTTIDVSVEAADEEVRLLVTDATMAAPEAGPGLPPKLVETMIALIPSYRISSTGDFVEIIDAQAKYDAAMAKLEMPDGAKQMIFGQYRPEPLTVAAKREWRSLVSRWKGRTLQVGVPVAEQVEIDLPNGQRAIANFEYTVERIGCDAGDAERRCVQITGDSKLEGDTAVQAMLAGSKNMGIEVEFKRAEIAQHFELVTDPSTLAPYRMLTRTGIDTDQVVMGEAVTSEIVSTERRTYKY